MILGLLVHDKLDQYMNLRLASVLDIGKIQPKRRKTLILLSMQRFRLQLKYKIQIQSFWDLKTYSRANIPVLLCLVVSRSHFLHHRRRNVVVNGLILNKYILFIFLFFGITSIQTIVIFANQLAFISYWYFWVIGG